MDVLSSSSLKVHGSLASSRPDIQPTLARTWLYKRLQHEAQLNFVKASTAKFHSQGRGYDGKLECNSTRLPWIRC